MELVLFYLLSMIPAYFILYAIMSKHMQKKFPALYNPENPSLRKSTIKIDRDFCFMGSLTWPISIPVLILAVIFKK